MSIALTVGVSLSSCASSKVVWDSDPAGNVIIYYAPQSGNGQLLKAAEKYGSKVLYVYKSINGVAVTVPKGKTVPDAIRYYEKVNGVLSVVKDEKIQLD